MGTFTVATYNCNSIRARLPIVRKWVQAHGPDVLCLQETKVQDKDFPALELEELGYNVTYRGQKSYNGVAILSKAEAVNVRTFLREPNEEARFLSAVIDDLPVLNVYVPQGMTPGSDKFQYKLQWLNSLYDLIIQNYRPDQPLLVVGDFNVALEPKDVYDPEGLDGEVGFHPEERKAMGRLLDWGLKDVFRLHHSSSGLYTFWDYRIPNAQKRKMGWRIDYILATAPLAQRSKWAWIDEQARALKRPSDHTFLVAVFEL